MDIFPEPTPEEQQELRDWITSQGLQEFPVDDTLTNMLAEIPMDAGQPTSANNGQHPAAYTAQHQGNLQGLQQPMPPHQLGNQTQDDRFKYPQSGRLPMPQIHGPLISEQNETTRQNQANFNANQGIAAAPTQGAETTNETESFDPSLFMDPALPLAPHLNQPHFSDLRSAYWKHFDFDYMTMPGEEEFVAPGQKFDFSQQPLLVDPAAFGIDLTPEQLGIQVAQPPAPEFDFEAYCDQLAQTPAPAQAPMANSNAPALQNTVQDRQFFPIGNTSVSGHGCYPTGGLMPLQNAVQNQPFAFNGGYMPQTATQTQPQFDFNMPLIPQATIANQQYAFGMPENTVVNQSFGSGNAPMSQPAQNMQAPATATMADPSSAHQQSHPASGFMPQPPPPGSQQYHVGYATVYFTGLQDLQGLIDAANSRPVSTLAYTDLTQKTDDSIAGVASPSASEAKYPQQNGQEAASQDTNASKGKAPVRSESTSSKLTVEASTSSPSTPAAAVADPLKRKRDEETADALLANIGNNQPAPKRRVSPPRAAILRAIAGDGQPVKRRVTPPRASRKTTSYVEPDEDDIYAPENEADTEDGKSKKKVTKKVRFDLPDDEEADATADAEVDEDTIVAAQRRL